MFSLNKQTPPPLPPPEQNGFKLELKLSEAALIKLVSIALPVVLSAGAGVWVVQSVSSPSVMPADAVEIVPSEVP